MNAEEGKISVIIPVYNRIAYLQAALESIASQTWPDYEVIMINDGSGPHVSRALLGLCDRFPFAQMLELDQHCGASTARNKGIMQAAGEYIHFLDDDDRIAPEMYEKCVQALGGYQTDAVITRGDVFSEEENNNLFKKQRRNFEYIRSAYENKAVDHWSYFLVYAPPIHAMVFRRNIFREVRFPEDLSYGEDRWLWLEMKRRGIRFRKLSFTGAFYRLGTKPEKSAGVKDAQIEFFEKLLRSDLVTSEEGRNYIHTFLCLASFRKGLVGRSIRHKLSALSHPFRFLRNLWYLKSLQ